MWIWTLKHTKSWELALYSILLPVCWAENNWGFPTVRIFPDSTVYVSARDGETWVWVLGKSRWPWHVSLIFRRCKLCRRNRVPHHAAESVHACVLCGCILVYGQSHTRGLCSDGDAESTVRGDDSYEQCLFAPPHPTPSNLRQAHWKESPRTLSTQFSPWEISDINRSTCLPYNP